MEQDTRDFLNDVIAAADKFILKVDTGHARSRETYADFKALRFQASVLLGHTIQQCWCRSCGKPGLHDEDCDDCARVRA
jgi:hypothetical protein